jgi:tRNA (guanine-N7-)-methyltransferase
MKKRYRQHVNPLKMTSLVPRRDPLDLPDGPDLEVELGCGDARFLIELALQSPDALFVGLDIREEFLAFGREEIARLELENVALETSNLIVDLDRLFFPGRVRRFYINFPDPWFKARQRNRRWLNEESVPALVQALARRGEVLYQTDVWELAIEALALFEGTEGLVNTEGEWCFLKGPNPFGVRSSRELACEEEGREIWRMLFVKLEGDEDEGYD